MSFVHLGYINVKKCHKPRGCIWCPEKIEIGESVKGWKGVMDGTFQQSYMHPECFEAMNRCEVVSAHDDDFIPWDESYNIRGKTMIETEEIRRKKYHG